MDSKEWVACLIIIGAILLAACATPLGFNLNLSALR